MAPEVAGSNPVIHPTNQVQTFQRQIRGLSVSRQAIGSPQCGIVRMAAVHSWRQSAHRKVRTSGLEGIMWAVRPDRHAGQHGQAGVYFGCHWRRNFLAICLTIERTGTEESIVGWWKQD